MNEPKLGREASLLTQLWGFPRHFHVNQTTVMALSPSALKDLVKLPVAAEWRQLGVQLGVPLHRLRRIQANNRNCPDFAQECLTDMFYWWLNSGRGKTYERLACALNAIGERDLAREFHQDCKKAIFFLSRF